MNRLKILFLLTFFFSTSVALLNFINSNMLSQYLNPSHVSLAFTLGAVLSLIYLYLVPVIITRFSVIQLLQASLFTSGISLCALSVVKTDIILPIFVLYIGTNVLIWHYIDILIEHYTPKDSVGSIRGTFLGVYSLAWVYVPISIGYILQFHSLNFLYRISALFVFLCFGIFTFFFRKETLQIQPNNIKKSFTELIKKPGLRRITSIFLILNIFYVWMTIFVPLYFIQIVGFSWQQTGIIFSVMIIPFLLLQYPLGKLTDKFHIEKYVIILSFAIIVLALSFLLKMSHNVWFFAAILFFTRVGASSIEVMCESYFFRNITEEDAILMSAYRSVGPLAYIIAPVFGTMIIMYGGYQLLFTALAGIMALAAIYTFRLD